MSDQQKVLFVKMRWILIVGALWSGGCQFADKPDQQTATSANHPHDLKEKAEVSAAVGVFSTYLSESAKIKCDAIAAIDNICIEDAIDPKNFFNALLDSGAFPNAIAASEQTDYQILIANQATSLSEPNWWDKSVRALTDSAPALANEMLHFTEITVQWRGLEIDSQLIKTYVDISDDHRQPVVAAQVINQWKDAAFQKGLFSAPFLFKALQASDYLNDLHVPETISAFTRLDTQLFHDPFQGAITRYTHNDYEDALLDITVYPLTASLEGSTDTALIDVLKREHSDATIVAQARNLTLLVDQPIAEFSVSGEKGFLLAIHAENDASEPLYATTYVFRQQDKVIKVSTTFPPRIANPLVEQALPIIKVPAESPLMASLREMTKSRARAK